MNAPPEPSFGYREIAARYGVRQQTVWAWKVRHEKHHPIPAPDWWEGHHPRWRMSRWPDWDTWRAGMPGRGNRADTSHAERRRRREWEIDQVARFVVSMPGTWRESVEAAALLNAQGGFTFVGPVSFLPDTDAGTTTYTGVMIDDKDLRRAIARARDLLVDCAKASVTAERPAAPSQE